MGCLFITLRILLLYFVLALQRIMHKGQNIEIYWNFHLWKNMGPQMLMWQNGMLEPSNSSRLTRHAVHQFEGKITFSLWRAVCKMDIIHILKMINFLIHYVWWVLRAIFADIIAHCNTTRVCFFQVMSYFILQVYFSPSLTIFTASHSTTSQSSSIFIGNRKAKC